jgi:hypothetical protein
MKGERSKRARPNVKTTGKQIALDGQFVRALTLDDKHEAARRALRTLPGPGHHGDQNGHPQR